MTCSLCKKEGHNKKNCATNTKPTSNIPLILMKQMKSDELQIICKNNKIENNNYSNEQMIFLIKNIQTFCTECRDPLNNDDMKNCLDQEDEPIIPRCLKKECIKCESNFCPGSLSSISNDGKIKYICVDCSMCIKCGDQVIDIWKDNLTEAGIVCEYCLTDS